MSMQRWLVTGASGQLGGHVVDRLATKDPAVNILPLAAHPADLPASYAAKPVPLEDLTGLAASVRDYAPTHILHMGAVTGVGQAHAAPDHARIVNVDATSVLADAANTCGARMVFASTDMVFDGTAAPYRAADPPRPLSHYGRSKAAAEAEVGRYADTLVVRLPLMYGFPFTNRQTTFVAQVRALRAGEPLRLFTDEYRTPIALADAARAIIALAESDQTGVIHVAGPQRLSRYQMGEAFAAALEVEKPNLVATSRLDIDTAEPRAEDLSLESGPFNRLFPHLAPRPITAESIGLSRPPART